MLPAHSCTPVDPETDPATAAVASVEAPAVSALLTQARAQERLRVQLANRRNAQKQPAPDYLGATTSAQLALDLREQAHLLDPAHTDPSWALDRLSHEAQCQWLRDYIARP